MAVSVLVIVEQGKAAVVGWEEEGGTAWRLNRPFSVALWSSACWISFSLKSCKIKLMQYGTVLCEIGTAVIMAFVIPKMIGLNRDDQHQPQPT